MDFSSANQPGAESIFFSVLNGWEWFSHSWILIVIKIFLMAYTIIVFINLVMLLMMRGVTANYRVTMRGSDIPLASKSKMQKRWDKVIARLGDGNESQYKVAIIEADAIADEILAGIGYKGANMGERLATIRPDQLDYMTDDLQRVHEVRNRIVHDETFKVDRDLAESTIKTFETFLRYLEFL